MKLRLSLLLTLSLCLEATAWDKIESDSLIVTETVQKQGAFKKFMNYFASSNEDKTLYKKFDFSVIGGPHYSSDTGFGIGLVAAGLYRTDRVNLDMPPSNISLFGDVSHTGYWLLGVKGNTFLKGAKQRIDFTSYFFSMPSLYWGIGYDDGVGDNVSDFKRLQLEITGEFLFSVTPSRAFYVGPGISYSYTEGKNFEYHGDPSQRDRIMDRVSTPSFRNVGIGATVIYDTRDVVTNAYKGIYINMTNTYYPKFMNKEGAFNALEFTFDGYHRLWKGAVLAYDFYLHSTQGDTPWTKLASIGGSYRMRGYYDGRFRDRNVITTQIEYRQKVYRRNGIALWVGAGNAFHSFRRFYWSHTLPNFGVGYRWEFKNRINVRLDYGVGIKGMNGFIFSINEAF